MEVLCNNSLTVTALFKCYFDAYEIGKEYNEEQEQQQQQQQQQELLPLFPLESCAKLSRIITIPIHKPLTLLTLHEWHDVLLSHYEESCKELISPSPASCMIEAVYLPQPQRICDAAVNGLIYLPSEVTEINKKWYVKVNLEMEHNKTSTMADVLPRQTNTCDTLPTSQIPVYELIVEIYVKYNTNSSECKAKLLANELEENSSECTKEESRQDKETHEISFVEHDDTDENNNNCKETNNAIFIIDEAVNDTQLHINKLEDEERVNRNRLIDLETSSFALINDSNIDLQRQWNALQTLRGNSLENGQLALFLRKLRRYPLDTTPLYLTEEGKQLRLNEYAVLVHEAENTATLSRDFDKFVTAENYIRASCNGSDARCTNMSHKTQITSEIKDDITPASFRAALQNAIIAERKAEQRAANELARIQYYTDADLPVPPRPATPPTPRILTMEDIPDDLYSDTIELFLQGRREIVTNERITYREMCKLMQRVIERQRQADTYAVTCAAASSLQAAASIFQLDTYMTNQQCVLSVNTDCIDYNNNSNNVLNREEEINMPVTKIQKMWYAVNGKNKSITTNTINNNKKYIFNEKEEEQNGKIVECTPKNNEKNNVEKISIPIKHTRTVENIEHIMHTLRERATVPLWARMERQTLFYYESTQRQEIVNCEEDHYKQIINIAKTHYHQKIYHVN